MQAGTLINRGSKYVGYLVLTIGIILVNVVIWTRIVVDAANQQVLSSTSLLTTALASTIALSLVLGIE